MTGLSGTLNQFHLKLEREMRKNQDIFLKIGYLNEGIIQSDLELSGWQGTIGFEMKR